MPSSEAFSVAVTTGLGVSVLAGLLSGICYVLSQGLGKRRTHSNAKPWHCNICGNKFRSFQGILEVEKVATCAKCKQKVCRIPCAKRDPLKGWICRECQQPEAWFKVILNALHPNRGSFFSNMDQDALDELDEDLMELRKKEREQVRDFIERLVESLLGGTLDDVDVGKLYNDRKYDALFERYHSDLSNALTDLGSALHISISRPPKEGGFPRTRQFIVIRWRDNTCSRDNDNQITECERELDSRTRFAMLVMYEFCANMFSGFFVAYFIGFWIAISTAMYYFHYIVEVVLDLPITGQSPCTAHATLKHLIQRFSSEAGELPELKRLQDHPALPENQITDRTYEDLLSTAIINKVVQGAQDAAARSGANGSVSSRASRRTYASNNNRECFFGAETLDEKWRNADGDTSSASSLDEWVRSDSSVGSAKYVDRISLTIKQRVDDGDVTTSDAESNHERESLEAEDSWSENWYLQKRLTSSNSPVPVPMLVPNPIEEAKVYIGDKEAGELSDIESDYGETETAPDIKHILVNSRTIIGGKNIIENVQAQNGDHKTVIKIDGEENNVEKNLETDEKIFEINQVGTVEEPQDVSIISIDSHPEKDTEYTEQYASLPRTIVKEPKPTPRSYKSRKRNSIESLTSCNGHQEQNKNEIDIEKTRDVENLKETVNGESTEPEMNGFEGSYSKKEKEKWKHAVELPNNPYSSENLERRLSNISSTCSTTTSLFGRDYYIRQASKSAGSTKSDYTPDNESPTNDEGTSVTAVLAFVVPEEEASNELSSIGDSSSTLTPSKPNQSDVSSDSDMSIERIYNPQTGTMIESVRGVVNEFPMNSSKSPEGIRYVEKGFDVPIDENQNRKQEFLRTLTTENDQNSPLIEDVIDVPYSFEEKKSLFDKPPETPKTLPPNLQKSLSKFDDITNEFGMDSKPEIITPIECDPIDVEFDEIPLKTKDLATYQIPPKYFGDLKDTIDNKLPNLTKTSDYSEEDSLETKEFSLENSSNGNDHFSRSESPLDADPEIIDLKEKKLVKDLLGIYSQSFPSIVSIPPKKPEVINIQKEVCEKTIDEEVIVTNGIDKQPEIIDTEEVTTNGISNGHEESDERDFIPSVQDLKKIFDQQREIDDAKKDSVQVYSLTARSLPKSIRQQLKSDEDVPIKSEEVEPMKEEETLLLADITKNRIKFFEQLEKMKQ